MSHITQALSHGGMRHVPVLFTFKKDGVVAILGVVLRQNCEVHEARCSIGSTCSMTGWVWDRRPAFTSRRRRAQGTMMLLNTL
jgi:hypothetical protein